MNPQRHHDPTRADTTRDRRSEESRSISRHAGASGERLESSDETGIPTGYPERSFESKRFPVTRQPPVKPTRTGRKSA